MPPTDQGLYDIDMHGESNTYRLGQSQSWGDTIGSVSDISGYNERYLRTERLAAMKIGESRQVRIAWAGNEDERPTLFVKRVA